MTQSIPHATKTTRVDNYYKIICYTITHGTPDRKNKTSYSTPEYASYTMG